MKRTYTFNQLVTTASSSHQAFWVTPGRCHWSDRISVHAPVFAATNSIRRYHDQPRATYGVTSGGCDTHPHFRSSSFSWENLFSMSLIIICTAPIAWALCFASWDLALLSSDVARLLEIPRGPFQRPCLHGTCVEWKVFLGHVRKETMILGGGRVGVD